MNAFAASRNLGAVLKRAPYESHQVCKMALQGKSKMGKIGALLDHNPQILGTTRPETSL